MPYLKVKDDYFVEMKRIAKEKLQEISDEKLFADVEHKCEIITHDVTADGIVEYARENDIDLIIIATHGYTGVRHLIVGSTTEKVVRHEPCPVLTVKHPEHDFIISQD